MASALTILFLYWSIVMLGRKVLQAKVGEETDLQKILLAGAGAVGVLLPLLLQILFGSAL